jgi:hypothetical protein
MGTNRRVRPTSSGALENVPTPTKNAHSFNRAESVSAPFIRVAVWRSEQAQHQHLMNPTATTMMNPSLRYLTFNQRNAAMRQSDTVEPLESDGSTTALPQRWHPKVQHQQRDKPDTFYEDEGAPDIERVITLNYKRLRWQAAACRVLGAACCAAVLLQLPIAHYLIFIPVEIWATTLAAVFFLFGLGYLKEWVQQSFRNIDSRHVALTTNGVRFDSLTFTNFGKAPTRITTLHVRRFCRFWFLSLSLLLCFTLTIARYCI